MVRKWSGWRCQPAVVNQFLTPFLTSSFRSFVLFSSLPSFPTAEIECQEKCRLHNADGHRPSDPPSSDRYPPNILPVCSWGCACFLRYGLGLCVCVCLCLSVLVCVWAPVCLDQMISSLVSIVVHHTLFLRHQTTNTWLRTMECWSAKSVWRTTRTSRAVHEYRQLAN